MSNDYMHVAHKILLNSAGVQFAKWARGNREPPESLVDAINNEEEFDVPAWDEDPDAWNAPWRNTNTEHPDELGRVPFRVVLDEGDQSLILTCDEGFDVDALSAFVQHLLKAMGRSDHELIEWCRTRDKNTPDAHGGGVIVVWHDRVVSMDTEAMGRRLVAEREGQQTFTLRAVADGTDDYDTTEVIVGTYEMAVSAAFDHIVNWVEGDWSTYSEMVDQFREHVAQREWEEAIDLWNEHSVLQLTIEPQEPTRSAIDPGDVDFSFPDGDDGDDEIEPDDEDNGDGAEDDGTEEESEQDPESE